MYGAMLGDIIGAPYEFDRSPKRKDFPLFKKTMSSFNSSRYTDDSLMTVAVCEALLDVKDKKMTEEEIKKTITKSILKWANAPEYKHIYSEYGANFRHFLQQKNPQPYNSMGNGSAMRVAAAGYLFDNLQDTLKYARLTAEVSHNHPEGVRGAEAVAAVIFLARNGVTKDEIKKYIIKTFASDDPKADNYNYNLQRSVAEIRTNYKHVETCPKCIPEAITRFLEAESYEDAIRNAISIGGDTDTIGCIVGSMAEAYYGVPQHLVDKCKEYITPEMQAVTDRFYAASMKLDTIKEEDFVPDKPSPLNYIERIEKYGNMTLTGLLDGLKEQMDDPNLGEKGREYCEFVKKMAEAGYPAGDIETLWMVNTVLNTEPVTMTDKISQSRDAAKAVLEEVISNTKDGQPEKLTIEKRTENLRKVQKALETYGETVGDTNPGLKSSNIRIMTDISIRGRVNAPLNPGDRVRMAGSIREMYDILDSTDPTFLSPSGEFIEMKTNLKKFALRTEKTNPDSENPEDKKKYENEKEKLRMSVSKYVQYKQKQLKRGRKRSEVEFRRVSAAEAILERLTKEDFERHPEPPKDLKAHNLIAKAKKVVTLKDENEKVKAAAVLISEKLILKEGQEVTYQRLMANYENLVRDSVFKDTVNRFNVAQIQEVILSGDLEETYSTLATREQLRKAEIEAEKERQIEKTKRSKEAARKAKLAKKNKTKTEPAKGPAAKGASKTEPAKRTDTKTTETKTTTVKKGKTK